MDGWVLCEWGPRWVEAASDQDGRVGLALNVSEHVPLDHQQPDVGWHVVDLERLVDLLLNYLQHWHCHSGSVVPPGLDSTRAIKQRTGCPGDRDCMNHHIFSLLVRQGRRGTDAPRLDSERTRTETRLRFAIRCAACTAMALISSVVLASRPAPGCARVPGCAPVDTQERMRAVHHLVQCVQCPLERRRIIPVVVAPGVPEGAVLVAGGPHFCRRPAILSAFNWFQTRRQVYLIL